MTADGVSPTGIARTVSSMLDGMVKIGQEGELKSETVVQLNSVEEHSELVHKWSHTHSILCVLPAATHGVLFCGTQDSKILVFDLDTYELKHVLNSEHGGQRPSILCMALTADETCLFSSGSDSLVRVWDLAHIEESIFCTTVIYSLVDIGDVFSIAWSESLSTLFIGAQNASILWCNLCIEKPYDAQEHFTSIERLPHFRYNKFFDSKGPGGSINDVQSKHESIRLNSLHAKKHAPIKLVEIRNEDMIRFAHNGFVNCMEYLKLEPGSNDFLHTLSKDCEGALITGGGDGDVTIWGVSKKINGSIQLEKLQRLHNEDSVLTFVIKNSDLYVGLSEPKINIWDLTTLSMIRTLNFTSNLHTFNEILSLDVDSNYIYKGSKRGGALRIKFKSFPATVFIDEDVNSEEHESVKLEWIEHANHISDVRSEHVSVLKIFKISGKTYLVTGGNNILSLWDISCNCNDPDPLEKYLEAGDNNNHEYIINSLRKFVAYKSISRYPHIYLDESRYCSQFLISLFLRLGASTTRAIPTKQNNPVVFASFNKNTKNAGASHKRVLWYGHYDVVEVSASSSWNTDPFTLSSKDGNLYARGVLDNKGPILAAMYAVAELHARKELSCDVCFVIEGEEECGSRGFQKVIEDNREIIGTIDWILLSNSSWLDDKTPCLNYGLRGVINARVSIDSDKPDLHSGVDGGVSKEPTLDLIQLLNHLINPKNNHIEIPCFYDKILPITEQETSFFRRIEEASKSSGNSLDFETLVSKWRSPSLTIHKIEVSGPNNNTVIPHKATASISIRIVPNQDLDDIKKSLVKKLEDEFEKFDTPNNLCIEVYYEAEPWLGDPQNLINQILYKKMCKHWGPNVPKPLLIREGGSIPCVRFLEKCFDAPVAHIPCGQASDNAHLPNEKVRVLNLIKLKDILFDIFGELE